MAGDPAAGAVWPAIGTPNVTANPEPASTGPGVQIHTATHPMNAAAHRPREFGKPVEIGADVWVGGAAIILPGVRAGDGAVIGAGSAITRDIPERKFAAGNSCRVIREIRSEVAVCG